MIVQDGIKKTERSDSQTIPSNQKRIHKSHPHVSEERESAPWLDWSVAIAVLFAGVFVSFGWLNLSVYILAVVSFIVASLRLILKEKSPWKVRSVVFDCIIGYAFTAGLLITYYSVLAIS